jgi:hypothetical protein
MSALLFCRTSFAGDAICTVRDLRNWLSQSDPNAFGILRIGILLPGRPDVFKTRRGIIQNKSELGIRAESSRPELSSPFEMEECQVTRAGKTKKQKY